MHLRISVNSRTAYCDASHSDASIDSDETGLVPIEGVAIAVGTGIEIGGRP